MGAYTTARRAAVTAADSARSAVGRAAYLAGLPVAHVLGTLADWCGRDGYEVHAAILSAEEAVVAWSARRAPDGRVVSPGERPCVEYRPEAPTVDLGSVVLGEVLERRLALLECAVEALAPIPVAEKRRSAHPCIACGSVVVLVLEGAQRSPGEWFNGLCSGCRTFAAAPPDAEVIP